MHPDTVAPGQLKDQGIAALLKGLAAASHGLCVVTTRYSLPDLRAFWQTTASEVKLLRLSRAAGVHLLKTLGVRGTEQEFATLVEDVKGHALTLTLLGGFLKRAFHGDIRQRDRVKFEKADEKMDGGHAFRTMAAYERWLLRDGGDEGRREVAVLRLMGLFDRPADAGCLAALRSETIPGLTEPLAGLADDDWEYCLSGLEKATLLTVNRDASGALVSLDAHPHLREYFAAQVRSPGFSRSGTSGPPEGGTTSDAWRAAHRRLYEYLCATTQEGDEPTLEDLQPLYQAVAHGCHALRYDEAADVYLRRIQQNALGQDTNYSTMKLGALGSNLGAIMCFFPTRWQPPSQLNSKTQALLLSSAGWNLNALGRFAEARDPMKRGIEVVERDNDLRKAASFTGDLAELEIVSGNLFAAVKIAKRSVNFTRNSTNLGRSRGVRYLAIHAHALHLSGNDQGSQRLFTEAGLIQAKDRDYPLLFSLAGFRNCDFRLAKVERAAWQCMVGHGTQTQLYSAINTVRLHCNQTLDWVTALQWLLTIALDHLSLGRAALYEAILRFGVTPRAGTAITKNEGKGGLSGSAFIANAEHVSTIQSVGHTLDKAVDGLRCAGQPMYIPFGVLTRAWLRFLTGARTGPGSAQEDLDEAWEIAERGPMKLFLADIHLYRARLFGNRKAETGKRKEGMQYPWESPAADLAAAEKLINDCGYHRRDEELADAKAVLLAP